MLSMWHIILINFHTSNLLCIAEINPIWSLCIILLLCYQILFARILLRIFSSVFIGICLLRNLYAGQEATVRTGHGTTDWFQIGKGVRQGYILSSCLSNFMWDAELDEAQAGIKLAGRNINNLRYADDTTLMAESEEELKSLHESESGEWKSWLKAQHSEN